MSIPFGTSIPFVEHLGITLEIFEGGQSELRFSPRHEHLNSFDVVHGGAIMSLLDVTMAMAARSVQPELGVVTIEMKTTFMRPARFTSGESFTGRGELQHRTSQMAFTEGRIYDPDGNLCATASGTFKYVTRRIASGPSTD